MVEPPNVKHLFQDTLAEANFNILRQTKKSETNASPPKSAWGRIRLIISGSLRIAVISEISAIFEVSALLMETAASCRNRRDAVTSRQD